MTNRDEISHHIQKHIIGVLRHQEVARFGELRPVHTATNLSSYHLAVLLKAGFVHKLEKGYTLSRNGLKYVGRVSGEKLQVRTQPKIITMLVLQNSDGNVLLQKRDKQPYINTWTLPYGKVSIDDSTTEIAMNRVAEEKIALRNQSLIHAGNAYIRVRAEGELLSTTFAHIFKASTDYIQLDETIIWARPHKLSTYHLAPAVEEIITRSFFNDADFFEEYEIEWTALTDTP